MRFFTLLTFVTLFLVFALSMAETTVLDVTNLETDLEEMLDATSSFEAIDFFKTEPNVLSSNTESSTTSKTNAPNKDLAGATQTQGSAEPQVGGMSQASFIGMMIGILSGIIGLVVVAGIIVSVIVALYITRSTGKVVAYDFQQKVEMEGDHVSLVDKKNKN
jgi:hypothetical protein